MKEARCIRYFKSRETADVACKVLKEEGFECFVEQDKFVDEPISKYGVPDRFKLMVSLSDYFKIAEVLAKKLNK